LAEFHARIAALPPLRPSAFRNWREEASNLTGPLFPGWFTAWLPRPLRYTVLGIPVWKLGFALLVAIALGALILAWARLMARFTRGARRVPQLLGRMTTPLLLAGLARIAEDFMAYQVNVTGGFGLGETLIATAVVYVAVAWLAWLACFLLAEAIIASPSFPDDAFDAHLLRIAARVTSPLAAGAVLGIGANAIGVPALGLVAGLGVGGIAIALAAQSTVENLFGGISIFADRPFRVGDSIRHGANAGRVEGIGPRSTRIRGQDGTLTSVPNGDLAKMHIANFAVRDKCLFQQRLGLSFGTSQAQLAALVPALEAVLAGEKLVEQAPGWPRARLVSLGPNTIDIELSAHVLTSDWAEFLAVQQRLILAVLAAVEAADSSLASVGQAVPASAQR
jgi:MscS family membrane protein